jgi:3-dehydroquinate synthase
MSNSAKQRSFIRDLIKHLEEIGLEVILEQSKNFILSIIYRDKKKKVAISCTPSNRAIAQLKALSDVKRTIAELDESIARAFNPQGLLQMMTNNGSLQNQNIGNEPTPDYESLRDSLTTTELDNSTIDDIISRLLDMGADKDTWIVGLGGGVITDMAGYVASIYKRGVKLVLIPTSILCMVDACLGGKNGVNTRDFKNMVGTIYQPERILYDYQLLNTLPKEEWVSGFAEIIKHASIADLHLFEWLEQHSLEHFQTHSNLLHDLIQRNVRIKLEIVKKDEREKNDRKLLNFGHTLGHAIEKKYQIPHGHAVSLGMVFASYVSEHFGLVNADEVKRLRHLLQAYHLPVQYNWSPEALMPLILQDKKKEGEFLQYVLLNGLGHAFTKAIDFVSFEALLKDYSK